MSRDDCARDLSLHDLVCEHKQEILSVVTEVRLRSYFLAHPLVAQPAFLALSDALRVRDRGSPAASFLLATTATELAITRLLFQPIVSGLLRDSSTAALVAKLAMERDGLKELVELVFRTLSDTVGIDLKTLRRSHGPEALWAEIRSLQAMRTHVVHRAHIVSAVDAEAAITVARALLEELFRAVLEALGLRADENGQVFCDWTLDPARLS